MQDNEDYYAILGIPPQASHEEVREAYRFWCYVLHPDRHMQSPERIRKDAEERLKQVNRAFVQLSDPHSRREYDSKRPATASRRGESSEGSAGRRATGAPMPRPEVYPKTIRFDDVFPYVVQRATFFVRNAGGPYSRVLVGTTPDWLKIVETAPLQPNSKLPMRVRLEAVGRQWADRYSAVVRIRLDDAEATVHVQLNMFTMADATKADAHGRQQRAPKTGGYQAKGVWHAHPIVGQLLQAIRWVRRNARKLTLSLAAVAVTAVVLSAVGQAASGAVSLLAAIVMCLLGLGLLGWLLRILSARRSRLAGMVMALLLSVIFIMLSCAYLDIRSPSDISDSIIGAFTTEEGQFRSTLESLAQKVGVTLVDTSEDPHALPTLQAAQDGSCEEHTKHVYIDGGVVVGADGHWITLVNNPDAADPSWGELEAFLARDDTDEQVYSYGSFVCADFAEMLHNNAEAEGIRAGYVVVDLADNPIFGRCGHALNGFETHDRGTVYIDSTGLFSWETYPCSCDKYVDARVGHQYIPESVFPCFGSQWDTMGTVTEIYITW